MGRLPAPMEYENDSYATRSGEGVSMFIMVLVGAIIGLSGYGVALVAGFFS